jgi:molybdopterin synthase sulfur carrier subunit
MKLRCYAYFRDIIGKSEFEWNAPAPTLGVLLGDLSQQYGKPFRRWVYEGEALSHMVIILVNGKDVRDLQGLDTPLKPDDTVVLFPPLAGG